MRLRITRQLYESIDGIHFSAFRSGYVYEVGTTIANYLLASGAAKPVGDDQPYLILPPEKHLFYPVPTVGAPPRPKPVRPPVVMAPALAADRPPRRRAQRSDRLSAGNSPRAASRLRARVAALAKKVEQIKDELELGRAS
jgi:hypothetical protein